MQKRSIRYFLAAALLLMVAVLLSGCTLRRRDSIAGADYQRSLVVDGLERNYIVHAPPSPSAGEQLPLVVVLHGTFGTGRKMQIGLGFDAYADERGFLVAYPDAYDGARWNDGRGTLESSAIGVDDVNFIVSMISELAGEWPVDPARVFVTGASNGGIMTYRLGCETSGMFAAIAPVIGNIAEPIAPRCAPQPPISLLSINGDADPVVPFEGGEVCPDVQRGCEKGWVIAADESLAKFAAANGCSSIPSPRDLPPSEADGTSIEVLVYDGCASGTAVELYIVHGGGHTWPPRAGQLPSAGTATANLDATEVIVRFFLGDG